MRVLAVTIYPVPSFPNRENRSQTIQSFMSISRKAILSPWLALLLLSVLVRMAYGKFLLLDLWPGDASWYMDAAQALATNGWADPYWPPALPHFLAGGLLLGIGPHWLGMVISLGFWVVFFWVLKTVVFERGNNPKGWLLKGIFLLFPAFIHQSVVPLTYLPVTILILMAWQWVAGSWGGHPLKEKIGLGTVLGLMALFRAASLVMWPVFLVGYAWNRGSWKSALIPGIIAIAMVGVWEARLYTQEDQLILVNSANSYNLYLGNNPWTPNDKTWLLGSEDLHHHPDYSAFYDQLDSVKALPGPHQNEAFRKLAWRHIAAHPLEFAQRVGSRFATLLSFDTLAGATMYKQSHAWGIFLLLLDALCYISLVVLAWLGWTGSKWRSNERLLWLGVCFSYMLPYLLAFSHPTYHLPLLSMFAWAAYRGDPFSWQDLKSRSWSSWGILGIFLAIQILWIANMMGEL